MGDGILVQRVRPTFEQFVSYAFEEAARFYISRLARKGQLLFLPERIVSWWDQNSEIDVLASSDSERALLVGECKWFANLVGIDILQDLRRKTKILQATNSWKSINYFLFAKSVFTPALKVQACLDENIRLISVEECLI